MLRFLIGIICILLHIPKKLTLVIITYKFEVLGYAGLCWPSLAFLAFMALDDFIRQKMAFDDKNQA